MFRSHRASDSTTSRAHLKPADLTKKILPEDLFLGLICLERKRAERSRKSFFLLLLELEPGIEQARRAVLGEALIRVAQGTRRETDPAGWYKNGSALGILFTELGTVAEESVVRMVSEKVRQCLATEVDSEDLRLVRVSIHTFEEDSQNKGPKDRLNTRFYPDLALRERDRRVSLRIKRAIDVLGSSAGLFLLAPLFGVLAILIKLSSPGPVLYRQRRVGQYCVPFDLLKFRSMLVDNNSQIHENYVKTFIEGKADPGPTKSTGRAVYKIKDDPRVTALGRFLRRTSLDELPQLWNVLMGEMSLVGPRPSLPYETAVYHAWHKRRLIEAKPGITGLWQVRGRSRTTFVQMVRMDLQYSATRTSLMDLQILLMTPKAVLVGDGAY
jgi:lipopolysaccharide/colanic/teichoic acid biosynthesis glycosyltransferase